MLLRLLLVACAPFAGSSVSDADADCVATRILPPCLGAACASAAPLALSSPAPVIDIIPATTIARSTSRREAPRAVNCSNPLPRAGAPGGGGAGAGGRRRGGGQGG